MDDGKAALGWDAGWAEALAAYPGLTAARVAIAHRGAVEVIDEGGGFWAEPTGKMFFGAGDRRALPVVGDWVGVADAERARATGSRASLQAILPRRSFLVRKAAGEREEPQPLVANVELVLVVTSANQDVNPRRLERYLATVRSGHARPVIAVNKIDLVGDPVAILSGIRTVAGDTEVVALSALRGDGVEAIAALLGPGRTAAVVGSSGVGKSTLVNALHGAAAQVTQPIRAHDDRGRHTTTRRALFLLPGGGLLIDTPGMRELALWDDDEDAPRFDDVEALATTCRFADCRHRNEPGCAVQAAVARGDLAADRLAGFHKLADELAASAARRVVRPRPGRPPPREPRDPRRR
ncbi:MAG TPA: ribosome small subunit-dependent GTPase A [Kofleriaceae bacterium]|nr:ribosome small subunit-dependent GTPase A [Kofleriaceae bacterium]